MTARLDSSAPHITDVAGFADLADWGEQKGSTDGPSRSSGRLLFKGANSSPETGVWVCTPGSWPLAIPRDEFCYFLSGRATYTARDGDVIEVVPGTVVHFTAGWTGNCTVHETLRVTYMLS